MDNAKTILLPWTMYICPNEKAAQKGGAEENPGTKLFFGMLAIVLGIYAGYLCWACNEREDTGVRVIYTGLAFANAIPYLIYYFFIRIVFKQECK
jgi:hypothetical protein